MNLYRSKLKGNAIPVTGLSLDTDYLENYMGNTSTLKVVVTPSNATHKNDYQIAVGDIEDADKIGTTFTKEDDTITVHFNGKTDGDEWYFHNGSVNYRWLTKNIPIVVSLDGFTATFNITMRPSGSYYRYINDSFNALEFNVIKKSTSNNSNIQLLNVIDYTRSPLGLISTNDASSKYRTLIDRYYKNRLSSQLYNKLSSFSKVVHSTLTSSTTYNAKYHLLAFNEIGNTLSSEEISDQTSFINLGSDTYPSIMSNPNIMASVGTLSRTIVKSKNWDGGWDANKMMLESNSVNSTSHGYFGDTDDNDDGVDYPAGTNPIISLPYNVSVNKLGTYNNIDYYEIDHTGLSSTKLSSVALGSKIYDLSGTRNGEIDTYLKNNSGFKDYNDNLEEVNDGSPITIVVEMFNGNNNFTVTMLNNNITAVVNGNEITFTGVNKRTASIATITGVNNGVTKQCDIGIYYIS